MLRQIARGYPGTLWRRIYTIPPTAAGVDITYSVPPHRAWQLLGVSVTLTASPTAGNRLPSLILRDNEQVTLAQIVSPTAITANLAPRVSWVTGAGAANVVAASFATLTLPTPWYMTPGESLTITGHTDPVDVWSAGRITVLETNTGDPAFEESIERNILDRIAAFDALIDL